MIDQNNISDLQNWQTLALPAAAIWNVTGFNAKWHVDQVRNGHRLLPSVYLALNGTTYGTSNNASTINNCLTAFAADLKWLSDNQVPLCIRSNNIADQFTDSRSSLPVDPTSIPQSVRVWSMMSTGLKQRGLADVFGPDAAWNAEGTALGKSQYVAALQAAYPSPPWLQFIENNEGAFDDYLMYTLAGQKNQWQPLATVNSMSLRMGDYLTANPTVTPSVFAETFYSKRTAKWNEFYSGFEAALSPAWQGKIQRVGYSAANNANGVTTIKMPDTHKLGYAPEALSYDSNSPGFYVQLHYSDFTSLQQLEALNRIPMWQWIEANRPSSRHHRDWSVKITNDSAALGFKAAKHAIITPAHWEGWLQWLLWATHDQGIPSMLRPWTASTVKPTSQFWTPVDIAFLQSAGVSAQVQNLTEHDYAIVPAIACDTICNDPTLRAFWQDSAPVVSPITRTPTDITLAKIAPGQVFPLAGMRKDYFRYLTCSANTPPNKWAWTSQNTISGTIKVWATARRAPDGSVLLYAYSPCGLSGTVSVGVPGIGEVVIDAPQPWGYWLVDTTGHAKQLNFSTGLVVQ